MRAIQIPDDLATRVEATGSQLERFVIDAVEQKLGHRLEPANTYEGLIGGGWTPPTVEGTPRADGRPWSEIEAACDPA
jgi:hypothetical protein